MTPDEIHKRMSELTTAHTAALQALVEPARAAVNAMIDAKMTRTADPLAEALFKYDAVNTEMGEFVRGNAEEVVRELIASMRKRGGQP